MEHEEQTNGRQISALPIDLNRESPLKPEWPRKGGHNFRILHSCAIGGIFGATWGSFGAKLHSFWSSGRTILLAFVGYVSDRSRIHEGTLCDHIGPLCDTLRFGAKNTTHQQMTFLTPFWKWILTVFTHYLGLQRKELTLLNGEVWVLNLDRFAPDLAVGIPSFTSPNVSVLLEASCKRRSHMKES